MAPSRARALLGGARIAGLALLLQPLLLVPALLLSVLIAQWRDVAWSDIDNLAAGLTCSLVVWLFIAVFHLRRERLVVPILDHDSFTARARRLLDEMGYEVTEATPETITARPGFHALLFGGGIHIALSGRDATLLGPRYALELLRSRLRVQGHLSRIQAALLEDRRPGEVLLQRVELRLRPTPAQLDTVRNHLLTPLAEHAEIVCELSVLARSEAGMPASTISALVRDGLKRAGLAADVHTDHVRLLAPIRPHTAAVSA